MLYPLSYKGLGPVRDQSGDGDVDVLPLHYGPTRVEPPGIEPRLSVNETEVTVCLRTGQVPRKPDSQRSKRLWSTYALYQAEPTQDFSSVWDLNPRPRPPKGSIHGLRTWLSVDIHFILKEQTPEVCSGHGVVSITKGSIRVLRTGRPALLP
jgi:hypothetical protein